MKDPRVEYIDEKISAGAGLTLEEVKADADIADAISKKHTSGSDNQDLSGLQPKYTSLVWDGSIFVDNPAITNDVLYIGSAAVSGAINLDNIPEGKEFILYVGDIKSGETVQLSVSGQFIPLSVSDIYLTNADNNTFYKFVLLNGYHYIVTGGFDGTLDDIADGVTYVKVSSAEKTVWNNKADQSFSVAMAVAL